MKNTIIAIVLVVLAGVSGYFTGSNDNASGVDIKKLEDSVIMMKEQSATIKKMGEIMKTNGVMMQDLGTKYKDEGLVMGGKDMMTIGEKYMKDDENQTTKDAPMKQIMGN